MTAAIPEVHDRLAKRRENLRKADRCVPLLRGLAAQRGVRGVTADDTYVIAKALKLVTGSETNTRALSWFACVPSRAGLVRTSKTRPGRNRNAHTVYVAREFAGAVP